VGLALTTIATGATTSATALRAYVNSIELYLNEGIATADLDQTSWVERTHIYGPSFFGAPHHRSRFETGQVLYRHTSQDILERTIHHYNANSGTAAYVGIEGLASTFVVPEALAQGSSPYYRLRTEAAFYAFEYGGTGGTADEGIVSPDTTHFRMFVNETGRSQSSRSIYTGSEAVMGPGLIYARHNHHMSETIVATGFTAGVHSVQVKVRVVAPALRQWQHIFVGGRNLRVGWWMR
jgi:hypothetical protein